MQTTAPTVTTEDQEEERQTSAQEVLEPLDRETLEETETPPSTLEEVEEVQVGLAPPLLQAQELTEVLEHLTRSLVQP